MASLIVADPRRAAKAMLDAYQRAGCSQKEMARLLGCSSHGTLPRWIALLEGAGTQVEAKMKRMKRLAKAEGWHHAANRRGGRRAKAVAA